jgi:hypothetical protein
MKYLPAAKTVNLVVQELRDETLIYDQATDRMFCLNETSAKVFNHCNGRTSFEELKRKHKFTDDLIYLALDEFKAKDLLTNYESVHFAGMSRREAVKRVGLASLVALPLISTLVAPTSTAAASGAAPTCSDGIMNGSETDTDCGGGTCPKCAAGRMCAVPSDCISNVCTGGICQSPTCNDGVRNGSETDVDCGGGICPSCASGRSCLSNSDCASGICTGGICQ